MLLEHVEYVLSDIKRVYPDYDADQGYEIAGFVWFQGFNDMINPTATAEYADHMANFIRDVRKDLGAPQPLHVQSRWRAVVDHRYAIGPRVFEGRDHAVPRVHSPAASSAERSR